MLRASSETSETAGLGILRRLPLPAGTSSSDSLSDSRDGNQAEKALSGGPIEQSVDPEEGELPLSPVSTESPPGQPPAVGDDSPPPGR